ncbi:hypothetical protein FEM48_Zijuj02G0029000 [Ziziphus jujuba var. spinosa]|uniref:acid phosphatase n=1 Tax=Ziziphus jujuba var. spinosa TaxID=714518 RepID=A0A978VT73_ZIZJJ|nr:hypothetical protein FEM48_Zijuj02G0029000 [Ziziphus jujuba var. spinosa]
MRSLHSTSRGANPHNLRFCHSSHSPSPKSLFLLLLPRTQFPSHQNLSSQTNSRKSSSSFSSGSVITASMAVSSPATGTQTGAERFSVLFVCLGNICRSPAAEGVFRDLVKKRGLDSKFQIDSAGTINYHEGNQADPRMRAASKKRGIEITSVSRPIRPSDFRDFDVKLMCSFCKRHDETEVPDPYYGGPQGFEQVLDLLEDACESLLDTIVAENKHVFDS